MNTDSEILDKIPANQIQKYIKKIIHYTQLEFFPGIQSWFSTHQSISVICYLNRMKDKKLMTLIIDAEKTFNKIQHPFVIIILNRLCKEGI